jgi:hypothetical protein
LKKSVIGADFGEGNFPPATKTAHCFGSDPKKFRRFFDREYHMEGISRDFVFIGNGHYVHFEGSGKISLLGWSRRRGKRSVKPNRKLQWVMEQAAEKEGIVWTPNVLRHSFCSYAVAEKGFTWTSLQADHSERMLREHYREVVTAQDAEKYWGIRPV